jgi:CheY-like chemotaxis protein
VTALILAIEPDRWRASQLKAIARRIGAELRLTDSMDGALAALNEQTPDLILTPALLSARDDQAFTDRLRSLGEAAAHIQTLTIPTLTEPSTAELSLSSTRMFAALRKDKSRPTGPAACDTDTFAEQVAFYLMGATEARRNHARAAIGSESPATAQPSQAAAQVAIEPSFEELDLTAFISEELLGPTPVHSISAPASPDDLTAIRAEMEAALSNALADPASQELEYFLPEDLTAAVPAKVPVRSELSEFESEGPPPSPVAADPNAWQFFDPAKPRFAALLAKLDEIAMRPA